MAADSDYADEWKDIDVLFLIWSTESNPFHGVVRTGALDAAKQQGINIDVQYGNEDPINQNNILELAIANEVDGIVTTVPNDDAFDEVLCRAVEAGIPVILHNIEDSKGKDGGTCRFAFVGQSFQSAGYAIGKRMIDEHGLKEGDVVFTPVEVPEAVYASERHKGVEKALEEAGVKTELLGVGVDQANARSLMTQYLLGHPDTAAVIGLGQTPTSQAVAAIREAGLDIPAGGFDVSQSIVEDIESGDLTATVDQQPYSQGYFSVAQMALLLKYGLYPSDMDTGGDGLIDSSNTGFLGRWAGETR
ncbi:substrate-binding domain-containing protein [Roseibium sp. HPY-6]|uniref:substrate-binding domain-containing protein n=1 Tax=Roseibium sp. HPY-6 TaxID=3229852 RepID=UPI00338E24CD